MQDSYAICLPVRPAQWETVRGDRREEGGGLQTGLLSTRTEIHCSCQEAAFETRVLGAPVPFPWVHTFGFRGRDHLIPVAVPRGWIIARASLLFSHGISINSYINSVHIIRIWGCLVFYLGYCKVILKLKLDYVFGKHSNMELPPFSTFGGCISNIHITIYNKLQLWVATK